MSDISASFVRRLLAHPRLVGTVDSAWIVVAAVVCSGLIAAFSISSSSLWMDEFGTWLLTRTSSISGWWNQIQAWPDSDSQIPIYHLYMYLWTGWFGTAPLAMRASNSILVIIATLALVWPLRARPAIALPLIMAACLSSPIWYYLNEIRPYMMLYAGACLMVGATIEICAAKDQPSPAVVGGLCFGAFLTCGATTIGVIWAGAIVLFNLIHWFAIAKRSLQDLIGNHGVTLLIAAACVAALIAHDFRMFFLGKNAASGESNIFTYLFSFYANFGLLGVGPGMLDLREIGPTVLLQFVPVIAPAVIVLGSVAVCGLFKIRVELNTSTLLLVVGLVLLATFGLFVLAKIVHWRVLPRHLIPLVALVNLVYAYGLSFCVRARTPGPVLATVAVAFMAYSCYCVRFEPRHAKDDYRQAANLAASELARGGRVWWIADPRGALYYGLPVGGPNLADPYSAFLAGEPPTLVLMSRPETYDAQSVVGDYLARYGFHQSASFAAFSGWQPGATDRSR